MIHFNGLLLNLKHNTVQCICNRSESNRCNNNTKDCTRDKVNHIISYNSDENLPKHRIVDESVLLVVSELSHQNDEHKSHTSAEQFQQDRFEWFS